jgi:hypothetical protein
MMEAFLTAHPNLRSALRVFVYAFLASFVPALLGFLNDVLEWSQDGAAFPGVDTVGKAAVSAVIGAIAALIAFVYNKVPIGVQSTYPVASPTPAPSTGGVPEQFPGEFPD